MRTERASDVSRCFPVEGGGLRVWSGPPHPLPAGSGCRVCRTLYFTRQTLPLVLLADCRHGLQHPPKMTKKIVLLTHNTDCRVRFRLEAARITVPIHSFGELCRAVLRLTKIDGPAGEATVRYGVSRTKPCFLSRRFCPVWLADRGTNALRRPRGKLRLNHNACPTPVNPTPGIIIGNL